MQYLSMRGRLVLINSVLGSIPTHYMSLFPILSKTLIKCTRLAGTSYGKEVATFTYYISSYGARSYNQKNKGGLDVSDFHNKRLHTK